MSVGLVCILATLFATYSSTSPAPNKRQAQRSDEKMFVQEGFFVNTEILQISMYTMILN
jgi:hypothetical protein